MKTILRTTVIATAIIASALGFAETAVADTSTSPGVTHVDNSASVKTATAAYTPGYTPSGAQICQDYRSKACGGDGRDNMP
jgi:hypothetical protein